MIISRIVASIRVVPIYICAGCGARRTGDTVRLHCDADSADAVSLLVRNTRATSSHMPVGWSYDGEFACERCNKKESAR